MEEDSREIERVHLNPEVASERFRGKYLDGSKTDFADGINKSRRKGYDALSCWELAPLGEDETVFQRFLRLKVFDLNIDFKFLLKGWSNPPYNFNFYITV